MTLAARGRFDEAVAQVRLGQALEPLSLVVHHHVAWVHLLARRYDEAIAQCRSASDMDPNFPMAHLWMGISLEQQGLYHGAIASLDRAVTCMRGASIGVAAAARAYAMSGRPEARRRLSELQHAAPGRYVQHYGIALVCLALGEPDEAFRWLERLSRSLVLAGLLGWSRSPAGCIAGRRAIQSTAASPRARIKLASGPPTPNAAF